MTLTFFWSHTIWYVLLNALTAAELILVFVRAKPRKFIYAFYTTISGAIIVLFEQIVFLLARGYDYYPLFLTTMPYYDNLLGKVSSQLSVSATALCVVVFRLNGWWIMLFAGLYGVIEEWFVALGVYQHHWYRTWMTVVSLVAYFWLAKAYFAYLLKGRLKPIIHYLNVFAGMFMLFICTPEPWIFVLTGLQTYVSGRFAHPFIINVLLINSVFGIAAIFTMLVYFLRVKWQWHIVALAAFNLINYLGYQKLNLLWFPNIWWCLLFASTNLLWIYFTVVWLDRWYGFDKQTARRNL